MLVEAPGGYGKSTLVAQLLDRRETSRWPAPAPNIVFFFVRAQGAQNTPFAFLQAVSSQLLDLLDLPGGVPPTLEELRVQFSDLWSAAVEATRADMPLLLVVDGLDEAAPGEPSIHDLLPGGLGDYVHVLVTSRPNPSARNAVDREHPLRFAEELSLEAFDEAGIGALLQRFGGGPDLAPAVRRLTAGEPLFARFVAEEVAREGPAALDRLERNPPADVEDYFRNELRSLDEAAEGDLSWDVLGLLAVALGGLRPTELGEALERPLRAVRKALEPIQRFLLAEEALELFHRSLQAFVEREFTRSELEGYRERLIRWCRSYEAAGWPAETPAYALAHYAEHLRDAGDVEALLALPDRRWMVRRRESDRSLAGFARDVELALASVDSGRPPLLAHEVRLCLIAASVRAVSTGVPAAAIGVLAAIGRIEEAQAHASLVQVPLWRSAAYRHLAGALHRRGDVEGARSALARALDAVASGGYETEIVPETMPEDYVAVTKEVAALARALADVRDEAGLERLLSATDPLGGARLEAMASVALGFALAGRSERAMEVARATLDGVAAHEPASPYEPPPWAAVPGTNRKLLVAAVARTFAHAGNVGEGQALAEAAFEDAPSPGSGEGQWDGYRRVEFLSAWASALADGPLSARAHGAAREALALAIRDGRYPESLPDALTATGDADGLEELLRSVAVQESDWGLVQLAAGLARLGRREAALEALDLSRGGLLHDEAAKAVAAGLAGSSYFGDALAVADACSTRWGRAEGLAAVAERFLAAGRVADAEATADRATTEAQRLDESDANPMAETFAAIAGALLEVGAHERGAAVADRALKVVTALSAEKRIPNVVARVATVLGRVGRFEEAFALAQFPEIPGHEARTLAEIGRGAEERGRSDVAASLAGRVRALADSSRSSTERVYALAALATLLAARGQRDAAAGALREAVALSLELDEREAPLTFGAGSIASRASLLVAALAESGLREEAIPLARRALEAWNAASPHWHLGHEPAQALSVLPGNEGEAWVRRISSTVEETGPAPERYLALRTVALAWQSVGGPAEALEYLRAALRAARLEGFRNRILEVLADGAAILAAVDSGQTLSNVYEALVEVDGWWGVTSP